MQPGSADHFEAIRSSELSFTGTGAQSFGVSDGGLPLYGLHSVNKPSGTLSLVSDVGLQSGGQDIQILSGVLDMAGFDLDINDQISIGASGTLRCSGGEYNSSGFSNSGLLDCPQQIVYTTAPSASSTTWTNFATQPVVTVRSLRGHTSNATTLPVTLTAYTDSGCTTASAATLIAPTNPLPAVAGVASFNGVQHHLEETMYLGASMGGVDSICSEAIVITMLPFTWTGNGGNTNWNNSANWSNNAVPSSVNVPIFDMNCYSFCDASINTNVNIAGIDLKFVFSGSITQNSGHTIDIGSSGWTQAAGTFNGGDSDISFGTGVGSNLTLSGGSFTSTSASLNINRNHCCPVRSLA